MYINYTQFCTGLLASLTTIVNLIKHHHNIQMQISCTNCALFREPETYILKHAFDSKYDTNTSSDFVVSNQKGKINFSKVLTSPELTAPNF